MSRTRAELDFLLPRLGVDLALDFPGPAGTWEDADLDVVRLATRVPRRRDLGTLAGVDAATQMLVNRLETHKGELAPLGHPEYGSRHHDLIGQPNVDRVRNLIKLYVLEALSHEPRIQKILDCRVFAPTSPPRDQVRIEIDVRLLDVASPLNLVIPFSLETAP